jgi:UPF0716 protein FxsA
MSLINKLLIFFVVLPLVELCLVLLLGNCIGIAWTLLFIIGTGLLGAWLANTQGVSVYRRIQNELSQGRMPTDSLIDAVLILIAGVLLIMPGVLTDIVGIVLMIPPSRALVRRGLIAWFKRHFKIQTLTTVSPMGSGDVIDSVATETKSQPRLP